MKKNFLSVVESVRKRRRLQKAERVKIARGVSVAGSCSDIFFFELSYCNIVVSRASHFFTTIVKLAIDVSLIFLSLSAACCFQTAMARRRSLFLRGWNFTFFKSPPRILIDSFEMQMPVLLAASLYCFWSKIKKPLVSEKTILDIVYVFLVGNNSSCFFFFFVFLVCHLFYSVITFENRGNFLSISLHRSSIKFITTFYSKFAIHGLD